MTRAYSLGSRTFIGVNPATSAAILIISLLRKLGVSLRTLDIQRRSGTGIRTYAGNSRTVAHSSRSCSSQPAYENQSQILSTIFLCCTSSDGSAFAIVFRFTATKAVFFNAVSARASPHRDLPTAGTSVAHCLPNLPLRLSDRSFSRDLDGT